MSSLGSKLGSIFGRKEVPTGQQFRDSLKDPNKSKVSFLTTSLQRAYDFFDFMAKRPALLVYYEPNQQAKTSYEVFFLQDHGEEIEKHFAFIGVTADSPEQALIVPHLPRRDVPVVVAFVYNELGKLTPLEGLVLTQENLKNKALVRAYLKKMAEVAQRTEQEFLEGHASLQAKVQRQQSRDARHEPHFDYDDDAHALPEDLALRKQVSTDRHVKSDQDKAYEETLRKIEEERKAKAEEEGRRRAVEEAEARRRREKDEFLQRLATEKVDPAHAISLQFRFPSGQKVVREFDRRSKAGLAHTFAGTFENKGFENPAADFELSAGFPPKVLDKAASLEAIFGNSDSEVVHVKET